jgi:hypothetical protein
MTNNGTTVSTPTTEAKKDGRGRKPGTVIWTHDKIMTRSSNAGIMDKAKASWLAATYGVEMDDNATRVMILANHSAVNKFWSESEENKAARADIAALTAEQEANKAKAEIQKVASGVTAETLLAALTPEQLASIVALAASLQK